MNKKTRTMLWTLVTALVLVVGIVVFQQPLLMNALASDAPAATEEPLAQTPAISEDTVLLTVNGTGITAKQINGIYSYLMGMYSSYGYDVSTEEAQNELFNMAVGSAVESALMLQKVTEMGITLTDEEKAEAQTSFDNSIKSYEDSLLAEIENPTDADKTRVREETLAAAAAQDFTIDYIMEIMLQTKLEAEVTKDITVTDADVDAYYDGLVEADKATYQNDFANYEMMMQYGSYFGTPAPMYVPVGVRGVKHILLEVPEEMTAAYQEAQAALEEALDETVATEDAQATEEPASNEGVKDIEAIKLEMIASVQAKVDEIMEKFNAGTSFDDLIAEYGTDPGMDVEPNKSQGYYLHLDSQMFDPAFKQAAFDQLSKVGDISAPVAGSYGVHILYYAMDVPEGAPALTAETRATYTAQVLAEKVQAYFTEQLTAWQAAANIEYNSAQ